MKKNHKWCSLLLSAVKCRIFEPTCLASTPFKQYLSALVTTLLVRHGFVADTRSIIKVFLLLDEKIKSQEKSLAFELCPLAVTKKARYAPQSSENGFNFFFLLGNVVCARGYE
jgi:hypothetical protein